MMFCDAFGERFLDRFPVKRMDIETLFKYDAATARIRVGRTGSVLPTEQIYWIRG